MNTGALRQLATQDDLPYRHFNIRGLHRTETCLWVCESQAPSKGKARKRRDPEAHLDVVGYGGMWEGQKRKDPKVWQVSDQCYHEHYHEKVQNQADIFCGALELSLMFPVNFQSHYQTNCIQMRSIAMCWPAYR